MLEVWSWHLTIRPGNLALALVVAHEMPKTSLPAEMQKVGNSRWILPACAKSNSWPQIPYQMNSTWVSRSTCFPCCTSIGKRPSMYIQYSQDQSNIEYNTDHYRCRIWEAREVTTHRSNIVNGLPSALCVSRLAAAICEALNMQCWNKNQHHHRISWKSSMFCRLALDAEHAQLLSLNWLNCSGRRIQRLAKSSLASKCHGHMLWASRNNCSSQWPSLSDRVG